MCSMFSSVLSLRSCVKSCRSKSVVRKFITVMLRSVCDAKIFKSEMAGSNGLFFSERHTHYNNHVGRIDLIFYEKFE